jgi:ribosome-binding factor A
VATDRLKRVNELLRRELGRVFEQLVNPEASSLVTVTDVKVAPDLRDALVFVSVYGTEEDGEALLSLLAKRRVPIQREIARNVVLKYTPRLRFKLDQSAAQADRVMAILEDLQLDEHDDEAEDPAAAPDNLPR